MMKPEEFYKKRDYPILDKFDKKVPKFDYFDLIGFAESYHQSQLKLLGIANVVDSKPEIKDALNHAVSAIYFNDNSDYLSGLYGTVRSLTGLEAPTDEDIANLFKKLNPE